MDLNLLESIAADADVSKALLDLVGGRDGRAMPGLESATAPLLETVQGDAALEAIVDAYGRPSLLIFAGDYEPPALKPWADRLQSARGALRQAIDATGRVDLVSDERLHLGTAWLIEPDIAVTNRHVARLFAEERNGVYAMRTARRGRGEQVVVDFRAEHGSTEHRDAVVAEVLFISSEVREEPDVAFLRLAGDSLPPPVPLGADRDLRAGEPVAAVGYPAFDQRNSAADQQRIFKGIYGVKRLAPGEVKGLSSTILTHDCTTLGGSSGSLVLSLVQGGVVGLHYSGVERVENRAVRLSHVQRLLDRALGRQGRVTKATVNPVVGGGVPEQLANRGGYQARDFLAPGMEVAPPAPVDGAVEVLTPLSEAGANGAPRYDLPYHNFSVWMHRDRKMPMITAVNIDGTVLRGLKRGDDRWQADTRIPAAAQVGEALFSDNALDRGHMVRRLDPAWGENASEAVLDTFHFTNCVPQHEDLNRREWADLEDYILHNTRTHGFRACVFTGPVFGDTDPKYRDVLLPQAFWKVVVTLLAPEEAGGAPRLASSGYVLSQEGFLNDLEFAFGPFRTFQVPLERLRRWAGLAFPTYVLEADAMLRTATEDVGYRPIWGVEDILI